MYLKFVGEDKSMGLSHGRIYDVQVKTKNNYLWVEIPNILFGAHGDVHTLLRKILQQIGN